MHLFSTRKKEIQICLNRIISFAHSHTQSIVTAMECTQHLAKKRLHADQTQLFVSRM